MFHPLAIFLKTKYSAFVKLLFVDTDFVSYTICIYAYFLLLNYLVVIHVGIIV